MSGGKIHLRLVLFSCVGYSSWTTQFGRLLLLWDTLLHPWGGGPAGRNPVWWTRVWAVPGRTMQYRGERAVLPQQEHPQSHGQLPVTSWAWEAHSHHILGDSNPQPSLSSEQGKFGPHKGAQSLLLNLVGEVELSYFSQQKKWGIGRAELHGKCLEHPKSGKHSAGLQDLKMSFQALLLEKTSCLETAPKVQRWHWWDIGGVSAFCSCWWCDIPVCWQTSGSVAQP